MKTQKQTNPLTWRALEAREPLYEIAKASSGLQSRDRGLTPISLLKILHCFGTAYKLGCERSRQRRQLMEMDDRQLKDIGITREQAEQEAHKPIWKG